jgi:hypothetical protein
MNPNPPEWREQAAIFKWAQIHDHEFPELKLLNGSLNGVRLSIGQATKAKRTGMKKGYPDIFLPIRRGIYPGLFIELKKKNGWIPKEGDDQHWWLTQLANQGFSCHVCRGADAAIATIKTYLGG